jgi:uncharacterized protein
VRLRFKVIRKQGRVFLYRLSWRTRDGGSVKIHLIVNDDLEAAHKHPWNFTSFPVLGAYKEEVDGVTVAHRPLTAIRRQVNERHRVILYRVFGRPLPCLTVGRYSPKLQPWCEHQNLCDFCTPLGECADTTYWKRRLQKKAGRTEMWHTSVVTLDAVEQAATSELARAALRHAARELAGDSSGHDLSHVLRVFRSAQELARAEGADLEKVEIIAALHDLKDFKFTGDTSTGPRAAHDWLLGSGSGEALAEGVANDIAGISFKGAGTPPQPLSLEGGCVQDADRLDALGAIGIARCFAYGGHVGRPLFDPAVPTVNHTTVESYLQTQGTSLNHFYEKLFLLRSRMNTASAKSIADARHEFMEKFVAQFLDEWNGQGQQ